MVLVDKMITFMAFTTLVFAMVTIAATLIW
jgi:hypothetical protein